MLNRTIIGTFNFDVTFEITNIYTAVELYDPLFVF